MLEVIAEEHAAGRDLDQEGRRSSLSDAVRKRFGEPAELIAELENLSAAETQKRLRRLLTLTGEERAHWVTQARTHLERLTREREAESCAHTRAVDSDDHWNGDRGQRGHDRVVMIAHGVHGA